jgi:hypothetical protein
MNQRTRILRRSRHTCTPALDLLESRQLLSAAPMSAQEAALAHHHHHLRSHHAAVVGRETGSRSPSGRNGRRSGRTSTTCLNWRRARPLKRPAVTLWAHQPGPIGATVSATPQRLKPDDRDRRADDPAHVPRAGPRGTGLASGLKSDCAREPVQTTPGGTAHRSE